MRVNIEEAAWKRIYKMALDHTLDLRLCIGTVGALWGNSQELVRESGSKDEIVKWAELSKLSTEEKEIWLKALEEVRFISPLNNSFFKIHGNKSQLESAAKYASRASKGGKALQKKLRELGKLKAGLKQATSGPQEAKRGSSQVKSMQFKSMQFNSSQSEVELLELSTDPIFTYLEQISNEAAVDGALAEIIASRIHADIHPIKTPYELQDAIVALGYLTTPDDWKWFLKAAMAYRDYCVTKKVKRIFGFKKFADQWTKWIPKNLSEGA